MVNESSQLTFIEEFACPFWLAYNLKSGQLKICIYGGSTACKVRYLEKFGDFILSNQYILIWNWGLCHHYLSFICIVNV
jgi:hypothetical protein